MFWQVTVQDMHGKVFVLCECDSVESSLEVVRVLLTLGDNGPEKIFLERRKRLNKD